MGDQAKKDFVRRQFGRNADDYRDASVFAEGPDIRWMVEAVALDGTERVLDIGTGAGHAALAFAPLVAECIGCDLTAEMVEVATQYARTRGIANVTYQIGDAESMDFPDACFDLVSCRFAAHHFSDVQQAVSEVARVLKPGGTFLLVDHVAPENPELDSFINRLDRMRDPSHVREYRLSEYRDLFARADLTYREDRSWDLPLQYEQWVERARTPREMRERLVEYLQAADPSCQETFRIQLDGRGYPLSFCLQCVLLHGEKR